ncbi:MAG: hypothetical protein TUN42_02905 [Dehalogenimonas sp.]
MRILEIFGRLVLLLFGLIVLVFGAHGLYAYFYRVEALFGRLSDLFFSIPMPYPEMGQAVKWMSTKGIVSWFLPAVVTFLGIGILWIAIREESSRVKN